MAPGWTDGEDLLLWPRKARPQPHRGSLGEKASGAQGPQGPDLAVAASPDEEGCGQGMRRPHHCWGCSLTPMSLLCIPDATQMLAHPAWGFTVITYQLCPPPTPHQPAPSPPAFATRLAPFPSSQHTHPPTPATHSSIPSPRLHTACGHKQQLPWASGVCGCGSHHQVIQEHIFSSGKFPSILTLQKPCILSAVRLQIFLSEVWVYAMGLHTHRIPLPCPPADWLCRAVLTKGQLSPKAASRCLASPEDIPLHLATWLCWMFQSHHVSSPCRVPQRSPMPRLCK